jgi:CheY-like chemotaxis protein
MAMKINGNNDVVMVDDSDADLTIARNCFEKSALKNRWLEFVSGDLFLQHLAKVKKGDASMPGVVLLDINMPKMNGFELLEKIRQDSYFKDLPIIMMLTNSDRAEDLKAARHLGANGFHQKPSSIEEFIHFFNSLNQKLPVNTP